jgi:hypothetical protein
VVDSDLPPRDAFGRFTGVIGSAAWEDHPGFWMKGDVTFAVAVNQNGDPGCAAIDDTDPGLGEEGGAPAASCSYTTLALMLKYALSKARWLEVDAAMAAEERLIQGVAMFDTADTAYLMADDAMIVRKDDPGVHKDAQSGVRRALELPSSRVGGNIVGAAYDDDRRLWTYFDDGRVGVTSKPAVSFGGGLSTGGAAAPVVLDALGGPVEFEIAPDLRVRDILDVAITDGQEDTLAVAYYANGTYSRGTPVDLALYAIAPYTLPPGQTPLDIVGVAMVDGDYNHVWVRYRDGGVSFGTLGDLDAGGYWRGTIDDIAIGFDGNTSLVYRTGFVRHLLGTLADNLPVKDAVGIGSTWLTLNDAVPNETPLLGVGAAAQHAVIMTSDGTFSRRGAIGFTPYAHGASSTLLVPTMNTPKPVKDIIGLAGSDDRTVTWWTDGTTTSGKDELLDEDGWSNFTTAPFQSPATVVGMAQAPGAGGIVWTLYRDGGVSAGTELDLDSIKYWKAPPVLLAP